MAQVCATLTYRNTWVAAPITPSDHARNVTFTACYFVASARCFKGRHIAEYLSILTNKIRKFDENPEMYSMP